MEEFGELNYPMPNEIVNDKNNVNIFSTLNNWPNNNIDMSITNGYYWSRNDSIPFTDSEAYDEKDDSDSVIVDASVFATLEKCEGDKAEIHEASIPCVESDPDEDICHQMKELVILPGVESQESTRTISLVEEVNEDNVKTASVETREETVTLAPSVDLWESVKEGYTAVKPDDFKSVVSLSTYGDAKLVLQNFNGEVFINTNSIKKKNVINPDQPAYNYEKVGGNELIHNACLDTDVQMAWHRVAQKFGSDELLKKPPDVYNFLYTTFVDYARNNRCTRWQFLKELSTLADVSHLCKLRQDYSED